MRAPNVLILQSHDSGRFFGCYGVSSVRTPHLDTLAQDGIVLENLTAASPICSPSRGALATGRWPQRNGLLGLTHHGFAFNAGERHAAAIFRDHGYDTNLFHFQHVADRDAWSELGFEQFHCRSRDDEFPNYPDMAHAAEEVGDAVSAWLQQREDDRPFFAEVNFNETHTPFDFGGVTPDTENGVTVPGWIEHNADAERHLAFLQGAIAALDRGIGKILQSLRTAGIADETLICFVSDHGFEAARDKWTCYEGGLGIAGVLRLSAQSIDGGRRLQSPVSNVDLLPTFLELAGIPVPDNLDGQSMASALRSGDEPDQRPVFSIYHNGGSRSVRLGDWKLILNFAAEPYQQRPPARLGGKVPTFARATTELYNLATDPFELNNVAPAHPTQVKTLKAALHEWMRTVGDPVVS